MNARYSRSKEYRGAWVAQSGKCPTPDFSSGHDLMVCGFEPLVGLCIDSTEPAWDSPSPSLSAPSLLMTETQMSVSLGINLKKKRMHFQKLWGGEAACPNFGVREGQLPSLL